MTALIRTVLLAPAADLTIRQQTAHAQDGRETGGILLGHLVEDVAVVRHAGEPGPQAVRTPTFFLRDREAAQRLANAAFAADASEWIGDWHTHVNGVPAPSRRDLRTYGRLLGDGELGFKVFISVIVATPGGQTEAWACGPSESARVRLIVDTGQPQRPT